MLNDWLLTHAFGGERNEKKKNEDQERDQDNLNVEHGNRNPRVGKTFEESRNFQAKWLKEHTLHLSPLI